MKIRKLLTFMFFFGFLTGNYTAQAQSLEGTHSVSAGMGAITNQVWEDEAIQFFSIIPRIYFSGPYIQNRCYCAALAISYKYSVTDALAVGLSGGFERLTGEVWEEGMHRDNFSRHSFTWVLESSINYGHRSNFSFYGLAGIGYTYNVIRTGGRLNLPDKFFGHDQVAFQITPAGIRFGKNLGVFAEAGFGYKGMLHGGLNYRFQ